MRWITKYRKQRLGALAAAIAVTAWMPTAMADAVPEKPELPVLADGDNKLQQGVNTINTANGKMDVELNANRAAINWDSFNIAQGKTVEFSRQNATGWAVLNRVTGNDLSNIAGNLIGKGGTVFLINPNGITFGAGAHVEVGSLVASTRDITDKNFTNGNYLFEGKQEAAITNLANIKAENGVVALIAHKVENKGTISGRQVNLVSGDNVELVNLDNALAQSSEAVLDYDNKIGVRVKTLSKGGQVINSGTLKADNGYVVMTAKNAQNIMQDLVNNEKVSAANRIYKDNAGNMVLLGDVNLAGDKVKVEKNAQTHASANDGQVGTFNVLSTNVVINDDSKDNAKISNTSLSNTLRDTNVNIVASPLQDNYYSDITIGKEIAKENTIKDTALTLTAGRNISVDAEITSTAGALDVELNANNSEKTKSTRTDGAVILRNNISTNGGNVTTTGKNGTYIGLNNSELEKRINNNETTDRKISTNGGNISLGGNELLLATGNTVEFNTQRTENGKVVKSGDVSIDGTVNSANAYSISSHAKTSWSKADAAAKAKWSNGTKSYLAVITGALEDAVVTATIPPDTNNKSEAYVGGHVVAVETDGNGNVIIDSSTGLPKVKFDNGNVVTLVNDKTNTTTDKEHKKGGWYKLSDGRYVRYWAWTDGNDNEKGKIFYVQTVGENIETDKKYGGDPSTSDTDWMKKPHGRKVDGVYSNFATGEPNDDKGDDDKSQTALSINYTSYKDEVRANNFYSKWDDVSSNSDKLSYYVVETELYPSSLTVNAGYVGLKGAVGNLSKLDNMTINSTGKVDMNGSVQLNNALDVNAQNDITATKFIDVGSTANLKSDSASVSTNAVTAGDTITLTAGEDVKIADKITSTKGTSLRTSLARTAANTNADANYSIVIKAQGNFENNVAESAKALNTNEDAGYYWKVYSDAPTNKLGNLNSNQFALWSWNGQDSVATTKDMYIFKATPTVTYTAFDKTKRYGETLTDMGYGNSYAVKNSLSGQYTQNFKDGIDAEFMARRTLDGAVTDGVTTSAGYPSTAYVGIYDIDVKGSNVAKAWGYDVVDKTAKLTVTGNNSEDVKPQLDPHDTTNVDGSASYTTAPQQADPGADRVLGLQSAELPFFREENGKIKLYGTYDVSVDPDKVKMEPTAKVLPEPDQPKNQYREYAKEIKTKAGTAKFKLTYNGSTFDIYPVDIFGKKVLKAGDAAKNVEVESQALFAAFKEMGITLDDLDGVYTHFDNKKEVQSFRK
ncbi:MAG: filamentous hemagglutinin N-terminal domain-containing protein [Selenomonas ruminantium]|jgi:filamentous hemagglutinin family protein|uniref:Filamentous hemagglutinin N-terminal domain-containing protein n=1 Tax=Selenomonas ruminantium TaxID=971 RepID=A0A927WI22_SELRU|nr:filamentous hemagglutinin N-terminal domain-containing protein [Selenomonas ruminantium]MBE6084841.1 filamentous hemagglutinin N-terminal domain-containing protein [Selenomonas ruminantium]